MRATTDVSIEQLGSLCSINAKHIRLTLASKFCKLACTFACLQCTSHKRSLDVHEWHGSFHGQDAQFLMTSVIGHVFSLDFLPQFQSWEVDPKDLFFAGTKKSEANPKACPLPEPCTGCPPLPALPFLNMQPITGLSLISILPFDGTSRLVHKASQGVTTALLPVVAWLPQGLYATHANYLRTSRVHNRHTCTHPSHLLVGLPRLSQHFRPALVPNRQPRFRAAGYGLPNA